VEKSTKVADHPNSGASSKEKCVVLPALRGRRANPLHTHQYHTTHLDMVVVGEESAAVERGEARRNHNRRAM